MPRLISVGHRFSDVITCFVGHYRW